MAYKSAPDLPRFKTTSENKMWDGDEHDHFLTEQVMTHTFLGFCFSQLCMFLHTAKRLWRLGAWREGQLHSETWEGVGIGNKREREE